MFSGRRGKLRRKQKQDSPSGFWDLLIEGIFWVPELIVLPFRLLFWLVRFLGRSLFHGL